MLALLLIIFFHEAFFSGKVFNVPDTVSSIQYETGYIEKARASGLNAFWNPYIFCGMPTWGSSSPGHGLYLHTFLDPLKPMILLQVYGILQSIINVFPLPDMFWDIFNYFLLGVFTYLFALRKKFDTPAAFIVACSVVFSLYSLNWIMGGHATKITVFAWLPAVLLLIDLLFERKSILRIALLIVALHLTFNSGHVQMIFYSLGVAVLYILYKLYEGEKAANVAFVGLIMVGAAAVAFLMLSGPYFATWEYKDFSIRGSGSGGSGHAAGPGGLDYEYATNWSFSLVEIITFFVPSFVGFGTPTYWGTMMFTESPIYLGIVVCTLAFMGILLRPKDRFVHFWIVMGLIALLISFGRNFSLLYDVFFYHVPFFNNFRIPSMVLFVEALCVGMLAGTGIMELVQRAKAVTRTAPVQKSIYQRMWLPAAIGVLFLIILSLSKDGMKTTISEGLQKNQPQSWNLVQQVERAVQAGQSSQVPAEYRDATLDGIYTMALNDTFVAVLFIVLVAGVATLFVRRKISYTMFFTALLLFVIVDWWRTDYKPMRMEPKRVQEQSLQRTDVVDYFQKQRGLFRILPHPSMHSGDNFYVAFGIQSVAGYHPAKMKFYDDIRNTVFQQFQMQDPAQIERTNWALLSMMNTRYVTVPSGTALNAPWLRPAFQGAAEDVYENTYVLPRAFFVGRAEVIPDDAAMFRKISTLPGYEPDRVAYLSEPLPADFQPGGEAGMERATVKVRSYTINSMGLDAETPHAAILKISDTYYPSGWTATIDGKPAEIRRTDYAFRAIAVPAGKHRIEMQYEPRSYRTGLIVTTVTNYLVGLVLLAYALIALRGWMRGRSKAAPSAR